MRPEDEQRLQDLDRKNITSIAGNYFARVFLAENRENELEVIRGELEKNTSMSGISNAIWANMQEMLESIKPKK